MSTTYNIAGKWQCDDSGIYYIQQVGEEVVWYGEQCANSPEWSNVAHGSISDNSIVLRWIDVPKGTNSYEGILVLQVSADGTSLTAVTKAGGFGGSNWSKIG